MIKKINEVYESGGGSSTGGVTSYNDLTDRPFNVSLNSTTLFEETVTTELAPGTPAAIGSIVGWTIDSMDSLPDSIVVTFEGTEYICEKQIEETSGVAFYGGSVSVEEEAYDFSEIPFVIGFMPANSVSLGAVMITESAGTYSVKAEALLETVTTTEDFEKAVESVGTGICVVRLRETLDQSDPSNAIVHYVMNKTWQEIYDADLSVIKIEREGFDVCIIPIYDVNYVEHNDTYTVGFGNTSLPDTFPDLFVTDSKNGYPSADAELGR